MLLYVDIVYRQRDPRGCDLPKAQCEKTRNGPFTASERAELYASSVANQTPVFETSIVEEGRS